jgi:hypothetical protein
VLKLTFNDDLSEIRKSNYYEEAEMHIKIDLPDYFNGLAKLERNVGEYNTDLEKFIDHEIPELATNYLQENLSELAISTHKTEVEPMNSISLPRLLSWLIDYWLRGREFDIHYLDGNFNYQWTNIATVPNGLETNLREMTIRLQNHSEILSQIKGLRERGNMLVNRVEGLRTEVQNTIVFHIERKTYNTRCKECP